jgi:cobalt-precorrin-5B (C1)-methyltransferase
MNAPRPGYTLPVFACAGAIAALKRIQGNDAIPSVTVNLVRPATTAEIPVEQVARLGDRRAMTITRSDPGDNLDLTRDTPFWVLIEYLSDKDGSGSEQSPGSEQSNADEITLRTDAIPGAEIVLRGGEGLGKLVQADGQPAIYYYARQLFEANLFPYLDTGDRLQITITLPEGRALAERTSNAAFGVVDGLSLLGTTGISHPLSAPGQLENFRQELQHKAQQHKALVFCIGENGLDLAGKWGVAPEQRIKTANWLGPMLVEAALLDVSEIHLFGYHGKLLKLAGGIFHTHHYVADGRREILTAYCAQAGLPLGDLQTILASDTAEAGLCYLRQQDQEQQSDWVEQVYGAIAQAICDRSAAYIHSHCGRQVTIGVTLFDRDRQIISQIQNLP